MQPVMTDAEIALLERRLSGCTSLLEFGCGGSTFVAARHVGRIVSVDSDPAWLAKVERTLAQEAVDFFPFHADIGPVGEWGYPMDEAHMRAWPRYHVAVWRQLSGSPDAVLVDGRFRVACLLQAVIHCRPDALFLFHDFQDRPQYHRVLKHVELIDSADTLAVLRARGDVDGKAVLHDLFDHYLVPD